MKKDQKVLALLLISANVVLISLATLIFMSI